MPTHRTVLAVLLALLAPHAFAERAGVPYRGPAELVQGGAPEGQEFTRQAIDGSILWSWWWEHNKDRFLARATAPGRVRAGSAYYWFGAGAKHPPRRIDPVTDAQRAGTVLAALVRAAERDRPAVRSEAYVALGRLGSVRAEDGSDAVVAALAAGVAREAPGSEERRSAILGLGISGEAEACDHLMAALERLPAPDRAVAAIALGLARHAPAAPRLAALLPAPGRGSPTDLELAAILGLGLLGPEAVPADSVDRIGRLASSRHAREAVVVQAVAALGRLQAELPRVVRALDSSSVDVEWAATLALAEYAGSGSDAAAKELVRRAAKATGQSRSFALCALGDLASRLGPNSAARAAILDFLRGRDALLRRDNHARACAALALGVAGDARATAAVAAILDDTTADDFAVGAACVSLGLLGATGHAGHVERVLGGTKWKPDARGYAALGLGLMGDTTRLDEVLALARKGEPEELERQLPLAIGLLGGRAECRALIDRFRGGWKAKERQAASNASFALAWIRDAGCVDDLARLVAESPDPSVRALAAAALGYCGMRRPVSPLARCLEGVSHRNGFAGWDLLHGISMIL